MAATLARLSLLSLIAVGLVLHGTEPSLGQSMPVPCSAFSRSADGGWKVLAPVMLYIGGRPLGPMVGSTLHAGSVSNAGKVSEVLDKECGREEMLLVAQGAGKR
jgi:hypothetical protein